MEVLVLGQHYLDYIDMSVFSSGLIANTNGYNLWGDVGAQINFVLNIGLIFSQHFLQESQSRGLKMETPGNGFYPIKF